MIRAHKIALDPTAAQVAYFTRASGVARFAWNWALARWQQEYALWREYRCGPRPSEVSLRRELNAVKDDAFPWMREVTKNAPQQAIKNVGQAFTNFFEGRAEYPTFKKKGRTRDSFRADNGPDKLRPNAVEVDGKRIRLPVIGWVRMREAVRFVGNIKSVTISRRANRWFASVSVEVNHVVPVRENQALVGADLGTRRMATLSGEIVPAPRALRRNLKKVKRLSRQLSRKVKGSRNRRKAAGKLGRLHARVANIRQDAVHKLTTRITARFDAIGIEDLNVRGMLANGKQALAISDAGMFEFRRQIQYKAAMNGCHVGVADRFFPSSKRCYDCGRVNRDLGREPEWTCPHCGVVHDRDVNASMNLELVAGSSLEASRLPEFAGRPVTVCGEESSDGRLLLVVKLASTKQKPKRGIKCHA